jgi:hypothetical protein
MYTNDNDFAMQMVCKVNKNGIDDRRDETRHMRTLGSEMESEEAKRSATVYCTN